MIAGHSMAGVTVPGVVAKLGSARVREMVLVTAFVPRQGQAIVDTFGGPLAAIARMPREAADRSRFPAWPRNTRSATASRNSATDDVEVVHRIGADTWRTRGP